ncbi:hypothetical protein [Stackebrandtia soli]|uniref:hypothetical protein n=1 Tax=Stackebrandtia soli TaxID=1892856 RepID=UPI0039EBF458
MPPRIPSDKRDAILADIRDGKLACRAIATKHGVSPSTVSKLKDENGPADAFERSQTLHATAARQADVRDLRSRLALRTLQRAHAILDRLDADTFVTKTATVTGEVITIRTDDPAPRDERDLAAAVSSYTTAAERVTDVEDASSAARSLLSGLGDALKVAAWNLDEPDERDATPQS